MIDASIRSIVDGKGVSREEMRDVFRSVMDGPASEVQKTALIVAFRMKGRPRRRSPAPPRRCASGWCRWM
jgi:anthranilate phosphoribosyltransferase